MRTLPTSTNLRLDDLEDLQDRLLGILDETQQELTVIGERLDTVRRFLVSTHSGSKEAPYQSGEMRVRGIGPDYWYG